MNQHHFDSHFQQAPHRLELFYGPDGQRRKTLRYEDQVLQSEKYFLGNYEKVVDAVGSITKEYHYISSPAGIIGLATRSNEGNFEFQFVLTDHLGSFQALLNENGTLEQEFSFDPWGNPRNPLTWQSDTTILPDFQRGFTGHEHLLEFGLINMNGRLYDPSLGRMLSPDNFVQSPGSALGFNRYAYCVNNPLVYTDPSGEWVHLVIGGIIGGISGYIMADNLGYKGWDKFWYTLGGTAIGAATGGIGASVTSSAGIVAGGLVGGAVSGAGFGTMGGYAAGLRGGDLINAGFTGMWQSAIAGGMGSIVGGAIGGGWGALAGGATSNLTRQLLANDFSFQDINWTSIGVSGITSIGIYHASSYVNWRSNVKNQEFHGRSLKYNQYLKMQASYTRGKFWGSERAGGGFWLTKDGISKQGVSYDSEHGNVVRFDYSKKPDDAWATFHPHPYNESETEFNDLWHSGSPYDTKAVQIKQFSSMIINTHGAELLTPISQHWINFWNYGKPYYIYPWTWW